MKGYLLLLLLFITVLSGCHEGENEKAAVSMAEYQALREQLEYAAAEISDLREQITALEEADSLARFQFRETINLAFRVLTAMARQDYDYLESVSSPDVVISREKNLLYITHDDISREQEMASVEFYELEYRFYHLADGKMTLGFAQYVDEGHFTIYLEFVRDEAAGKWLFHDLGFNK